MRVLTAPRIILFDWHATLVDTLDAVYHAIEDMLPRLKQLGLIDRLLQPTDSKTEDDARLVDYVRQFRRLHPKVKAARRVSRTDLFEVLFGCDEQAKHIAHEAFDRSYTDHYGEVHAFEDGVTAMLCELKSLGLIMGVSTNRNREFLKHELDIVAGGAWRDLFAIIVAGDDAGKRKPAPDLLLESLKNLGVKPGADCWYVGDSTTDTAAAKSAGMTSIFYNGAGWGPAWLQKIFPGTPQHPYQPDAVIDNFNQLLELVKTCIEPVRA